MKSDFKHLIFFFFFFTELGKYKPVLRFAWSKQEWPTPKLREHHWCWSVPGSDGWSPAVAY